MTAVVDADRDKAFLRALGDELRQARKRRGWTRGDLHIRITCDISMQTLATYELGTRRCSVLRLVELAEALHVSALDLLRRAMNRVGIVDEHAERLYLDLYAVIGDGTPELAPLRRWAQSRLDHTEDGQPTSIQLDLPTLQHLGDVCGIGTDKLITTLRGLTSGTMGA